MVQEINRLDESHDERVFIMNSAGERDKFMRAFPHPMPGTHRMDYAWDGPEQMKLIIKPVPIDASAPATEIDHRAPAVRTAEDASTAKKATDIEALNKLELPDLLTKAAERGVKTNKSMSKAQIVALITGK